MARYAVSEGQGKEETRRLNLEYAKTVLLGAEGKLPLYDINSFNKQEET